MDATQPVVELSDRMELLVMYVKLAGEWKIHRTRLTRLQRDFTPKPEAPR